MFKKNKKQTENIKEKKVRTVKVGTHQRNHRASLAGHQRDRKFREEFCEVLLHMEQQQRSD